MDSMRMLLLLQVGGLLCAQSIQVIPSTPVVQQGQSIQFTANRAVVWSLAPGSRGSITPTGFYTAPSSLPVAHKAGPCQLLPANHIFNTPIDKLPVHPESGAMMATIPEGRVLYNPSWGLNPVTNETPLRQLTFFYTPSNNSSFPIPSWPDLQRQNGIFTSARSEVDRHIAMLNRDTCEFSEIYSDYEPGVNPACANCTAQSGVKYGGLSYALPVTGATDAAGLPLQPLSAHLAEVYAGVIPHMMRMTLANSRLKRAFVWPATANAFIPSGIIPYGAIFRLKAGFNIRRFSPIARIFLTQMKNYGLITSDGGIDFDITTFTDLTKDPSVLNALNEIRTKGPLRSDFEVVDQSSLMVRSDAGMVQWNNPNNGGAPYAVVIAADATNPAVREEIYIALQGVTVGTPDAAMWIQSGASTQLTAWVKGTPNSGVNWSMSPSLGTLSSTGRYTAPAVTNPQTITITATAQADATATAVIQMTILPAGPIRIDTGNFVQPYWDSSGNIWYTDQGSESSQTFLQNLSYAGDHPWPAIPDMTLHHTLRYSLGDWIYKFIVPNGNYRIRLKFGIGGKGDLPKGLFLRTIEANGQLVRQNLDLYDLVGGKRSTPGDLDIPAWVQDGSLYVALRRVTFPDQSLPNPPDLNALEITRDNAGARLSIDGSAAPITASQTRQFYAVGWFMPNVVSWSIGSGPGTISAGGLYTAPSTPPGTDTVVTIRATSALDTSKSATFQFPFVFGSMSIGGAEAPLGRGLSRQFNAFNNGVPNRNVTWSVSPAIGQINTLGVYTAPDQLSLDTTVSITARSTDDTTKSVSVPLKLVALAQPIRINCGGTYITQQFTDAQGRFWALDYGYSTPTLSYTNSSASISGTTADMLPLYQSSRYRYAGESFHYQFDVPNGTYRVTLKFADYAFDVSGRFNFDVKINSSTVLSGFDPAQVAGGGKRAIDMTFQVAVVNKSIRLDFIANREGAFVNGIEILAQ